MGQKWGVQSTILGSCSSPALENSLLQGISRSGIHRILYKSGNVQCACQPSYVNCQILNICARICIVKSHYNIHSAWTPHGLASLQDRSPTSSQGQEESFRHLSMASLLSSLRAPRIRDSKSCFRRSPLNCSHNAAFMWPRTGFMSALFQFPVRGLI